MSGSRWAAPPGHWCCVDLRSGDVAHADRRGGRRSAICRRPSRLRARRRQPPGGAIRSEVASHHGAAGDTRHRRDAHRGRAGAVLRGGQRHGRVRGRGGTVARRRRSHRAPAARCSPDMRSYHHPRFSPDGKRISVDFTGPEGRDVWILNLADGAFTRATFDRDGHDASWSRDGRSLAYTSFRGGVLGVNRIRPGSTQSGDSLLTSPYLAYTGIWLRDESALVTVGQSLQPESNLDIAIVRNGGRGPDRAASSRRDSSSSIPRCRPTTSGSPSAPTSPAARRCTCADSTGRASRSRCRSAAGPNRSGARMERSCTTGAR